MMKSREWMARARRQEDLSQAAAAKRIGVSLSTWQRYEAGSQFPGEKYPLIIEMLPSIKERVREELHALFIEGNPEVSLKALEPILSGEESAAMNSS